MTSPMDPQLMFCRIVELEHQVQELESSAAMYRGLWNSACNGSVFSQLASERDRYRAALIRLRDCDWVITPADRVEAVLAFIRETLQLPTQDPELPTQGCQLPTQDLKKPVLSATGDKMSPTDHIVDADEKVTPSGCLCRKCNELEAQLQEAKAKLASQAMGMADDDDELTALRARLDAIEAAKAGEPEMPGFAICSTGSRDQTGNEVVTTTATDIEGLYAWGRLGWDTAAALRVELADAKAHERERILEELQKFTGWEESMDAFRAALEGK